LKKDASLRTFIVLIVVYAVLAGVSVFLPKGDSVPTQTVPLPAPLPVMALASGGLVFIAYGGLGLLGFLLARKLGLPEIWDAAVTNRQRFLIPALVGIAIGLLIILGDVIFSPINGMGHFPHPPFPTSLIAAITAGIGEETLFRLFFTSFWTWLVSRVILRGRWQTPVYWIVSVLAAIAFGVSHMPGIMFLQGWTDFSQVPPVLLVEIIFLNGILGMAAAWLFKKFGFLAPVGVHLWADIVWHVLWGAL
jgi:hypothetical protein